MIKSSRILVEMDICKYFIRLTKINRIAYLCLMKMKSGLLLFFLLCQLGGFAQCVMCKSNAKSSLDNGAGVAAGLNSGIQYMLVIPYLVLLVVGIAWYRQYKKKDIARG